MDEWQKYGLERRGDVPTFASGYVCKQDRNANSQLEAFVLVKKGQLEMFNAFLNALLTVMKNQGRKGDMKETLKSLKTISIMLNIGETIDLQVAPRIFLQIALGFPVSNKIFDITLEQVRQMPDPDFQSWVKAMEASVNKVKGHIENNVIWQALGNDPTPNFAFVKVADLP